MDLCWRREGLYWRSRCLWRDNRRRRIDRCDGNEVRKTRKLGRAGLGLRARFGRTRLGRAGLGRARRGAVKTTPLGSVGVSPTPRWRRRRRRRRQDEAAARAEAARDLAAASESNAEGDAHTPARSDRATFGRAPRGINDGAAKEVSELLRGLDRHAVVREENELARVAAEALQAVRVELPRELRVGA